MKTNKEKAKETIDIIEKGFKTEKIIHVGYIEWLRIKKLEESGELKPFSFPLRQYFGKYRYNFTKGTMRISLIKILGNGVTNHGRWVWEMYAYEDRRLFSDTRKFPTKKEAMKTVESYLG